MRGKCGVPLTSIHQPLSHRLRNIKGDPLRRSFGQDVLAPNVALFGFGVIFLEDLRGKMKMWPSCINSFYFYTHMRAQNRDCLSEPDSPGCLWAKCLLFMEKVTPCVDIPILQVNACVLPSCQWEPGRPSRQPFKLWLILHTQCQKVSLRAFKAAALLECRGFHWAKTDRGKYSLYLHQHVSEQRCLSVGRNVFGWWVWALSPTAVLWITRFLNNVSI